MIEFRKVTQAFIKHICEDIGKRFPIDRVIFTLRISNRYTRTNYIRDREYPIDISTGGHSLTDVITQVAEEIVNASRIDDLWDIYISSFDNKCDIKIDIDRNAKGMTEPSSLVHVTLNPDGVPIMPDHTMSLCGLFEVYNESPNGTSEDYCVLLYDTNTPKEDVD